MNLRKRPSSGLHVGIPPSTLSSCLPERDSDMRTTRSFWEKPATGQQWRGRGVRCGPPDSGLEKGGAGGLCASAGSAPPCPPQPCSSVGEAHPAEWGNRQPPLHFRLAFQHKPRTFFLKCRPTDGHIWGSPGSPTMTPDVAESTQAQGRWGTALGAGASPTLHSPARDQTPHSQPSP